MSSILGSGTLVKVCALLSAILVSQLHKSAMKMFKNFYENILQTKNLYQGKTIHYQQIFKYVM